MTDATESNNKKSNKKPVSKDNHHKDIANHTKSNSKISFIQKALNNLGLTSPMHMALHLPLRYEDETTLMNLEQIQSTLVEGQTLHFEAPVTQQSTVFKPRRQLMVTLVQGKIQCNLRFFNFFPWQQELMKVGNNIRVRGEIKNIGYGNMGLTLLQPQVKAATEPLPQTLTPIYPTTAGLPQNYLRKVIANALYKINITETIPDTLKRSYEAQFGILYTLKDALNLLHMPPQSMALEALQDKNHPAWQRLKMEELLAQQLSQLQVKRAHASRQAPRLIRASTLAKGHFPSLEPITANQSMTNQTTAPTADCYTRFMQALPFALTRAQSRVIDEIVQDLQQNHPMNRLLQGDVGSGKTIVAALAAVWAIDAQWQCVLMAPTEILVTQHFQKLLTWLEPLGVSIAWLASSQKTKERKDMLRRIESGQAQLIVGTHAVIQEKVSFKQLGLVIIDEQHRFGVAQRLALRQKSLQSSHQLEPHLLMMSATPIPRTLAMSYYADLDISTLDELPPGRSPITTKVIHHNRRDEIIQRIGQHIQQGQQVYWVCPLIEESETLDLSNATQTHAYLSQALAPSGRVALMHARLPATEKETIMQSFIANDTQVLVSTTVIEVGVDVPNASLMVIENAQRFGLSQLHQLRGRVGRGSAKSTCILLYSQGDGAGLSFTAKERLKAMASTQDGFEIARRDLQIRGPGELMGARQSGVVLMRFANLNEDASLLAWTQSQAATMLDHYPHLAQQHIARWLGNAIDYIHA